MLKQLSHVSYMEEAPDFPPQRRTAAMQAGLNFETAVVKKLNHLYPKVVAGPWLRYTATNKASFCQPDALLHLNDKHIVIVEVKLSWQKDARLKLTTFYGPLIKWLHPDAALSYVQVYKNWREGCHKRSLTIYELDDIKPGAYRECHFLGL